MKSGTNRRVETLTKTFECIIRVGSILHADGYPLYPQVAKNSSIIHKYVNHNVDFVSTDGTHTNNQEGFWAHLQGTTSKKHGVQRKNIDSWISEYTFKRR